MTGVTLTVDDARITAELRRLVELTERPRPVMNAIGTRLESSTKRRFETGTAPGGTPWRPSGRAAETGGQTLLDRGNLRDSVTYVAGDDFVEVGSNLVYAAIHQTGGTIRAKGDGKLTFRVGDRWVSKVSVEIPARPFLGVDDEDRAAILALLDDAINDRLGEFGPIA